MFEIHSIAAPSVLGSSHIIATFCVFDQFHSIAAPSVLRTPPSSKEVHRAAEAEFVPKSPSTDIFVSSSGGASSRTSIFS